MLHASDMYAGHFYDDDDGRTGKVNNKGCRLIRKVLLIWGQSNQPLMA